MATTYEPIATTTLSSAAASITFSSISSAYTDLRLVVTSTSSSNATQWIRLNSDTASNYSLTAIRGNGATASSWRDASTAISIASEYTGASSTIPILVTIDLFSYAGSTNKTCLVTESDDQNGSGDTIKRVALWRSTSAINTISINRDNGNFNSGTTATLYGILKA